MTRTVTESDASKTWSRDLAMTHIHQSLVQLFALKDETFLFRSRKSVDFAKEK